MNAKQLAYAIRDLAIELESAPPAALARVLASTVLARAVINEANDEAIARAVRDASNRLREDVQECADHMARLRVQTNRQAAAARKG